MTTATKGEQRDVLRAFWRALAREEHILKTSDLDRFPQLVWQQLYNRLQPREGPVAQTVRPALIRRSRADAPAWLRLRHRHRESEALIRILVGYTGEATACAFSPDGTRIVAAGWDWVDRRPIGRTNRRDQDARSAVRLWDAYSGRDLLTFADDLYVISGCAFSPDGRTIVCASAFGLSLWDSTTGTGLGWLAGHGDGVSVDSCAFSPDGSTIVSGDGRTLKLWDATSRAEIWTQSSGSACAFSPDGQTIVSASADQGVLTLWDAHTGDCRAVLTSQRDHVVGVNSCAFSPNGRTVAAACRDNTVRVWDVVSGGEVWVMSGHTGMVTSCAYSPDGTTIVTAGGHLLEDGLGVTAGSRDTTLRLWDAATGAGLGVLVGHTDAVNACAFSPNGKTIVSASLDTTLMVWDAASGFASDPPSGHTQAVSSCAFSPDGQTIISGSRDTTLKLWDARTGAERATMEGHTGPVSACAFAPDGETAVSGDACGALRLWEVGSATGSLILSGLTEAISACAFLPDGETIVSADVRETLAFWDAGRPSRLRPFAEEREPRAIRESGGIMCAAVVSPDGPAVITVARGLSSPRLCAVGIGAESEPAIDIGGLTGLTGQTSSARATVISPDGKLVAVSDRQPLDLLYIGGREKRSQPFRDEPALKVWETHTGKLRALLHGLKNAPNACAFAADGNTIATASGDEAFRGTVRIWDARSGSEITRLPGFHAFWSCAFSPRGDALCCGDAAGNVFILEPVGRLEAPPPPARDAWTRSTVGDARTRFAADQAVKDAGDRALRDLLRDRRNRSPRDDSG